MPKYDLDLLFPFSIRSTGIETDSIDSSATKLDAWVNVLTTPVTKGTKSNWKELRTEFPSVNGDHRLTEYSEWVFFHPFIRSFLYDSKNDRKQHGPNPYGGKSVRILLREEMDDATLSVDYYSDGDGLQTVTLPIRDIQLYLFDTGIGVLAIRMTRDLSPVQPALTLKQVLDVQDKVRRLYAPYFDQLNDSGKTIAGHCADSLTLNRPKAEQPQSQVVIAGFGTHSDSEGKDAEGRKLVEEHIKFVQQQCEPFTNQIWRELLLPMKPRAILTELQDQDSDAVSPQLTYEHILDDRMPLLSYLAVDDPRRISEADWIRLAVVDDSGDSDKYPYSPGFLPKNNPLEGFAYDRFWAMPKDQYGNLTFQGTRWLCCGYGFSAVGHANDARFFTHETSGARAHVRYHYFKLNLIAHFHRASLLVFKKRLADAVEELQQSKVCSEQRLKQFEQEISGIQLDLLAFRNMYWFTEISNQIQPQELFDMQSKHLRNRELFQTVFEESEKASAFLVSLQGQEQTELAARFNVIAAAFFIVGPVVQVMFSSDAGSGDTKLTTRMIGTLLCSAGALLTVLGLSQVIKPLMRRLSTYRIEKEIRGPKPFGSLAIGFGVLLLILSYFLYRTQKASDKVNGEDSKSGKESVKMQNDESRKIVPQTDKALPAVTPQSAESVTVPGPSAASSVNASQ